ncbi:MAG: hypothetical protein ACRD1T_23145, partial [Acidimicrobiia bacterium]
TYKTQLASARDAADQLRFTLERAQVGREALETDLRAIRSLEEKNAELAKSVAMKESDLNAAQARLASVEGDLEKLKTTQVADRNRLQTTEAELKAAQQRLATSEQERQKLAVSVSRAAESFNDTWAFDWDRLSQDPKYAASWNREAAVADFRIGPDGKVVDSEVVRKSQTFDANSVVRSFNWTANGLTTHEGRRLPANVTCIVLPESAGNPVNAR